MKILEIQHLKTTDREDYTNITFECYSLFGKNKEVTKTCITPNWNIGTHIASTGDNIDIGLWSVVKSFINTGDKHHNYR